MGTVAKEVTVCLEEEKFYVRDDEDYSLATILIEPIGMRKVLEYLAAALGIALALISAAAVLSWLLW